MVKVKWASLMYHVQNIHVWATGACEHGPLTDGPRDPDGRQLEYFSRYEPAFRALQKIVMDQQWLKSLKFYTRFRYVSIPSTTKVMCDPLSLLEIIKDQKLVSWFLKIGYFIGY